MRLSLLFSLAAFLVGSTAAAQQPTTVQLPTFCFFTVQTAVSVPDGGGAPIAGIQRSRDGKLNRGMGPLASRSGGSDRAAGGVSVHATIIDHLEIDDLLAAASARRSGVDPDPATARAGELTRHVAGAGALGPPAESLAGIRAEKDAAAAERVSEAADLLAKGQQAEADRKLGAAKVYYQMAARRGTAAIREQASQRLAALAAPNRK